MRKTIMSIVSALLLIGSFMAAAFFMEDRYAKADALADNSQRLNVQDRINFLQHQMWAMEDRVGNDISRMTHDQRQRYREMKAEKQRLEEYLRTLGKGGKL
jgi:hypothetical protein